MLSTAPLDPEGDHFWQPASPSSLRMKSEERAQASNECEGFSATHHCVVSLSLASAPRGWVQIGDDESSSTFLSLMKECLCDSIEMGCGDLRPCDASRISGFPTWISD